jgi:hypothetical protein
VKRILNPDLSLAASPALLQQGCVAVIGLEEIKAQVGPRWEKMKRSIYAHADGLLRQKLGPTDFYAQLDELSFVVSSPNAAQDECQILCLLVAHELHRFLFGDCDISGLHVSRAKTLTGDVLECEIIEGASLIRLAEKAGLAPAGQSASQSSTPASPTPASPRPLRADPVAAREPSHIFAPLWDARNEIITTYRCLTITESVAHPGDTPQAQFKADLHAVVNRLQVAAHTLAERLSTGDRFIASIPISYEILGSPVARMELSTQCRSLPSALRPYLQFEISDLPPGVPQSRLSELVGSLRPFCRGVMAHLPAHLPAHGAYQCTGLQAIGLSLSGAHIGIGEIARGLSKLAAASKRLQVKSFVMDIPDLDTLIAARDMDIDMLSGPLIGASSARPGLAVRLPFCDIVSHAPENWPESCFPIAMRA